PASLATVSNTIRASLVIFRLMGARASGISSGGFSINLGSSRGGAGGASAAALRAAIVSRVFRISCSAIALAGSIARAFWNSARVKYRLDIHAPPAENNLASLAPVLKQSKLRPY